MENQVKLSEFEATELANKLKAQLQIGDIPKPDKIELSRMIAGLGDERGLIRRTFTESLSLVGLPAVPSLREALIHHANVRVRRSAAKTLKLIGDPTSLPDLLHALTTDPDPVVQASSAGAMAIFGESAVELLIKVLISPTSTAMQCGLASWGLSFIGSEAPTALRKAAESENSSVRAAAIAALADQIHSLNDAAARQLLVNALKDPSTQVRSEATKSIGQLNENEWKEELLIKMLSDKKSQVRINAALSLMKSNSIDVIDHMVDRKTMENDKDVVKVLDLAINQLRKHKGWGGKHS